MKRLFRVGNYFRTGPDYKTCKNRMAKRNPNVIFLIYGVGTREKSKLLAHRAIWLQYFFSFPGRNKVLLRLTTFSDGRWTLLLSDQETTWQASCSTALIFERRHLGLSISRQMILFGMRCYSHTKWSVPLKIASMNWPFETRTRQWLQECNNELTTQILNSLARSKNQPTGSVFENSIHCCY